jgi:signal transduction histidine kinase
LLDSRDGLSANDVLQVWCDEDGTVWFGTANGLNRYRPGRTPPTVRIRDIRSHRAYSDLKQVPDLILGAPVSIDYTSIDFRTHRDKRRYRCQLVWLGEEPSSHAGVRDADWRTATGRSTFDWVPERAGWFRFAVQAVDRDLNYSEPAELLLHVVAPWYANAWITAPLLASVVALAFGTVFSTWRYWVKRRESQLARVRMQAQEAFSHEVITRQEEERKRIAAELHDSLGQSLLVVKSRALMGLQTPGDASALATQLTEISDTASQAIAETRQIAFNLRPHQLDSLGLHKGIAAMAAKVCRAADLRLTTDIDNVSGLVPPESQIHLFRIAQEALNNVVKHARATAVRLELKKGDSFLILRIEDDGRGMPTDASDTLTIRSNPGHGTNNLTERVRFLKGRLDITAGALDGTVVTVKVPRMSDVPPRSDEKQ